MMNQHQNNQQLRELFSLPPIQPSASTALVVPDMPPQQVVTGHLEVDAVLWLQQVVRTGNQVLIDKALEAAQRIKTPMKELGRQYAEHIARTTGNTFGAALSSFGFGELEEQAKRAIEQAARRLEAMSRFGDETALFADTPAEKACKKALRGLKRPNYFYDDDQAKERFERHPALVPATIDDCLHVMGYWDSLYLLRCSAADHAGDLLQQASAHDSYCFARMAEVRPRSEAEAMRAFEYVTGDGRMDRTHSPAVLRNLIASSWACSAREAA